MITIFTHKIFTLKYLMSEHQPNKTFTKKNPHTHTHKQQSCWWLFGRIRKKNTHDHYHLAIYIYFESFWASVFFVFVVVVVEMNTSTNTQMVSRHTNIIKTNIQTHFHHKFIHLFKMNENNLAISRCFRCCYWQFVVLRFIYFEVFVLFCFLSF